MTKLPRSHLRIADLPNRRATDFLVEPTADERAAIAEALDIIAIRKLRFSGKLSPIGKRDWRLDAELGATVVQSCVVTLEPVSTRIDEDVSRSYLSDLPEVLSGEVEMPEDDTQEALPESLDLAAVMIEALSLALPAYPRAEGAELGEAVFAQTGVTPLRDEDTKPFAGLAELRESLEKKGK
ncbi:YceD family protein [Yoonia litorea]|uniref:Uncharacterized metal-binding protein YceD, DUF177 family n=1 Tax=Yoonia litorea TaxID=1123755 RepID=A0A1I6LZF2_9RHOB|nr:DUF177 domain-containing protein [Yoonia litorea]SFS08851.1 Uncharacterized metal-binding protein YceD, DUF177 family [Yoonia litorea]